MGLLCGRPECMKSCAPFVNIAQDDSDLKKYTLNREGIYIKNDSI